MPRFEINEAGPEDRAELCRLFRLPMEGSIAIAAEREPDYFLSAAVQNEEPLVFVGRDRDLGRLAGVFSVGRRRVFINGDETWLPYFCDLRVLPEYRRGTLLSRGYRFVRERVLDGDRFAQTIVVADNKQALDALTSGRGGLPTYYPRGEYLTYAIGLKNKIKNESSRSGNYSLRPASRQDATIMQAFFDREAPSKQFYPRYEFSRMTGMDAGYYAGVWIENFLLAFEGETLVGLLGVWDQKAYKQTRVSSYSPMLGAIRPLYNLGATISRGIKLPPAGSLLDYFCLHTILTRAGEPEIFAVLIDAVLRNYRNSAYEYFLCGLSGEDPLNAVLGSYRNRIFRGRHFLVSFGKDPRNELDDRDFYLETARI